ncbi:putative transposon Ty3-G Gag-Pol polyprotein [Clavispora lusitaniae]|uniref:Transposon Ty3-G Gag-Pol polyprotein n=3 Tax=Clavispora lusitaniae TaxID=36911 RepID=A0ACD0WI85_CLALS|nr:putative transposon Ty3-G Gag-Pol polyprotein [Clavispora lusitaniae]QFZ27101.1 putative transposon Ty3-G Gag-Pol polyprotein [Clavispora lusitaniae]QFZ27139.1 putative transposon Ty3-G Gag-Pol polyprotein [Clavispora lusitaniae]QFZ32483.1 putative transposon Ty3-G Gag-Pol polyprotein [Clavispora lusitaniae]QFZ33553.1 putative transposon Ty3-G Gag-Pol polyprotein [Clavispora lusitaniae]
MLDTGAASDLVSPTVVRELNAKLQPVEIPLALGHCQEGETTPITHKVTLMSVWDGREAYRSFAVCPKLRDKVLLGRVFIEDHRQQLGSKIPQVSQEVPLTASSAKYETIGIQALERECKKKNNDLFTLLVQRIEYDEDAHPGVAPVDFDLSRYEKVVTDALPAGLPPERQVKHRILLVEGSTPPHRPPYRLSHNDKQELTKQIEALLKDGKVIPFGSPYGAPVIFVHKKDGSKRLCIDYRALNSITVKERFPLPLIDDIFDALQGAKVFSSLDLHSGYHQVAIAEEDYDKTAFVTPQGQYAWRVMPFGLTNAPATFQRLMNVIFHKLLNKTVVVYLDDILVFSKTREDHKRDLDEVLQILQANGLIAKRKKCYFFQTRLNFLGHVISSEGIAPNEDKIKAVKDWPPRKDPKDMQRFLGLTTYYRRFIKKYAHIAASLYDFAAGKSDWTEDTSKSFNELKDRLTSAPVLILPDPNKTYVVHTDASDRCVGAVLEQQDEEGKILGVIAYESKKLNGAQLNYPVREKECLAIHYALKKWQHYLIGKKFYLYTDHQSLNYIYTTKHQNPRILRWLEFFSRFDFKPDYKSGSQNVVADALSRRGGDMLTVNQIGLLEVPDVMNRQIMQQEYLQDSQFVDIYRKLVLNEEIKHPHRIKNKLRKYTAVDGILRYAISTTDTPRICVPIGVVRESVLRQAHDAELNNHPGALKMYEILGRQFYWAKMLDDCKAYAKDCKVCQLMKTSTQSPYGLLQPMPLPSQRWTEISMDYISGMPESTKGNEKLLVVVDRLTKMVHLIPMPLDLEPQGLFNLFMKEVIRLHGIPKAITSDRDPTFTSRTWDIVTRYLGIDRRLSTVGHPQTDGQTERMNRMVEQQVRTLINTHPNLEWDEVLPLAEFAINGSYQTAIGTTPFFANYGFHPRTSFIEPVPGTPIPFSDNPIINIKDTLRTHTIILQQIRENMAQAQDIMERQANRHRRELILHPGDQVALRRRFVFPTHSQTKWLPPYIGPFTVERRINDNAYEINIPSHLTQNNIINVENMKPFREHEHDILIIPPSLPLDIDRRINDIVKIRSIDEAQLFFTVEWRNVDPLLPKTLHVEDYLKLSREKRCQLEQDYNEFREPNDQYHSEIRWDRPTSQSRQTSPAPRVPTPREPTPYRLPSLRDPIIARGRPRSRRGRMLGRKSRSRARR